jgi:hypothetical protein
MFRAVSRFVRLSFVSIVATTFLAGVAMAPAFARRRYRMSAIGGKADIGCCTAYPLMTQSGHVAPFHSITLSARRSIESGTVIPSALAVLRLITNSNLVGCSTGTLAGLAPLRILST